MKSYLYSIQEAFEGFKRARFSSIMSIFTIAFLLFIVGFFGLLSLNVNRLIQVLNAKIDIQLFISNTMDDQAVADLGAKILAYEVVENVEFISKDIAAKELEKEFGEDLFILLEDNPLPSSFIVKIKKDYRSLKYVKNLTNDLKSLPGIDEIVYPSFELGVLSKFSKIATIVNSIIFVIVFLGSFFVVSNTIRLIIHARQHIIKTMKLVGAKESFIRRPYIIEGVLQGLIGGIIAFSALYGLNSLIHYYYPGLLVVTFKQMSVIIVAGLVFGLTGSLFAIKKFL